MVRSFTTSVLKERGASAGAHSLSRPVSSGSGNYYFLSSERAAKSREEISLIKAYTGVCACTCLCVHMSVHERVCVRA